MARCGLNGSAAEIRITGTTTSLVFWRDGDFHLDLIFRLLSTDFDLFHCGRQSSR